MSGFHGFANSREGAFDRSYVEIKSTGALASAPARTNVAPVLLTELLSQAEYTTPTENSCTIFGDKSNMSEERPVNPDSKSNEQNITRRNNLRQITTSHGNRTRTRTRKRQDISAKRDNTHTQDRRWIKNNSKQNSKKIANSQDRWTTKNLHPNKPVMPTGNVVLLSRSRAVETSSSVDAYRLPSNISRYGSRRENVDKHLQHDQRGNTDINRRSTLRETQHNISLHPCPPTHPPPIEHVTQNSNTTLLSNKTASLRTKDSHTFFRSKILSPRDDRQEKKNVRKIRPPKK